MTQPQRTPVGRGYRQQFDLVQAAASSLDASTRIDALLSSSGSAQGSQELDELISNLGEAYVEEGRVKWEPPQGLDPAFVEYLSRSVQELNNQLEAGTLTVDQDGNIRPTTEAETPAQTSQAPPQWRR